MSMSSPAPLHPRSSTLNPLMALDSFLASLDPPPSTTNNANHGKMSTSVDSPTTAEATAVNITKKIQARRKLILRVADCLFGGNLLEGAISILDSYIVSEVISVTSSRRMFILTNAAIRRRNNRQEESNTYFCLVPPAPPESQNDVSPPPPQQENNCSDRSRRRPCHVGGGGFLFCSCRSYFERTKSLASAASGGGGGGQSGDPQAYIVCKHLLALKLRTHLQENCKVIETVTEDQFSQEIIKRLGFAQAI